jgi:hypothetical protein
VFRCDQNGGSDGLVVFKSSLGESQRIEMSRSWPNRWRLVLIVHGRWNGVVPAGSS